MLPGSPLPLRVIWSLWSVVVPGPKKAGVGLENPVGFPVQGSDSIQLTLGTSPTPPPVTQKTQWKSVGQWEVAAGKPVVATRKLRRGSGYYYPVFSLSMQSLKAV